MWDKRKMLAFIEQSKYSAGRLMDSLIENGIEEIDSFEIVSESEPFGVKITVHKGDKYATLRCSEVERCKANEPK